MLFLNRPEQDRGRLQVNRFSHVRAFPDASFTAVVSPNADTLYSTAWLDLAAEPLVLGVPASGGRYCLLPMLSGWTDVFASPGTRTTGNGRGPSGSSARTRMASCRRDCRRCARRPPWRW